MVPEQSDGALYHPGRVLVVSGVDGAGKSTLVESLVARLGVTERVARVSGGKPQGALLEALRCRMRQDTTAAKGGRGHDMGCRRRHKTGIVRDALPSLVLALLRWRVSRQARRLARAGVTVVADRWPTLEHGKMDGPKIAREVSGLKGAVLRLLAGWESAIYRHIEPADIAFYLIVDEQTAIRRNAERVKEGKESADDIIRRYRENLDFQPIAHRVERIDNSGSLQEVLAILEQYLERA